MPDLISKLKWWCKVEPYINEKQGINEEGAIFFGTTYQDL